MQVHPEDGAPPRVGAGTAAALKDVMSNLLTYVHSKYMKRRINTLAALATGTVCQKSFLLVRPNLVQGTLPSTQFRNKLMTLQNLANVEMIISGDHEHF